MSAGAPTGRESDRCHNATAQGQAGGQDDDADRVRRVLDARPEGCPFIHLARTVFPGVEPGDADWYWARRECWRQGRPVLKRADGLLWVTPTPGEGVLDTASGRTRHSPHDRASGAPRTLARANAEAMLGRRRALATAAEWGDVVGALGAKRLGEERSEGGPQRTRFNDLGRALTGRDHVREAFAGATAAGHDRGVLLTATTHMARFDSLAGAAEGLVRDADLLRKRLGRPPGVTVIEPTERGAPHAHVALFTDPEALPSKHDLHGYWWERRKRGQQVDTAPLVTDGDAWTWADADARPADADGCPPAPYLGAGSRALATTAALDADAVLAVASAYRARGDAPLDAQTAADLDAAVAAETGVARPGRVRRAAWYWATDLRTATRPSPALREAAA